MIEVMDYPKNSQQNQVQDWKKQREQHEGCSKAPCDLHRGKVELKGTVPSEKNILGDAITICETVSGTKWMKRALIAWFL